MVSQTVAILPRGTRATVTARDAAAKGLDAFKVAAGEVGKTCGGCHKDYRIQKK